MSMIFSDIVEKADALIDENARSGVDHDLDTLAYLLAVRADVPKWVAREALQNAYKKRVSSAGGKENARKV